ncbi:MAG: homoserine dehydrogenase [Actinomycetota bacterium]
MNGAVRVGLLGCGIVGGGTARILIEHADDLRQRAGVPIELARIAVRDLTKPRAVELPSEIWTDNPNEVVKDPDIDIVVEVIGGIEPPKNLILDSLSAGKHVVTANKELLATQGQELFKVAAEKGVDFLFEGAVAGGIPIIRPLKESLAGDRVKRVLGIVNGTTNFILTRMSEQAESFPEALAEAERLGYTELDPSADIEGYDAAAKLAILASIAFNARVVQDNVHREGIAQVKKRDIVAAHDLGYEVKLLAVAERQDDEIALSVHPSMIPRRHPLAAVRDVFNAVFVEGVETGELMFLGRGAGSGPTGSAVVGDIVEIARNIRTGGRSPGCTCYRNPARIRHKDMARVRYYAVLSVVDQPGVLAAIAGVFADNGVSIASVRQEGFADEATLVVITHAATEGQHQATFRDLAELSVVKSLDSTMRVHGTAEEE